MSSYLFVLCPPYCGSTLLWKLLSTSANVSALPDEGQFLPELKDIMRDRPWDAENSLPWPDIKQVWDAYWDRDKPVLLEKSPPNIIRTGDILAHFQPVQFIIMVRNPYAQSEGLMRRNHWPARRAANFAMMCLRTQLKNRRQLDNATVLTYESLVQDPAGACAAIVESNPELFQDNFQASNIGTFCLCEFADVLFGEVDGMFLINDESLGTVNKTAELIDTPGSQ